MITIPTEEDFLAVDDPPPDIEPPVNGVADEDRHLLKDGETRSAYRVAADEKPPGRTAAEFWASSVVLLFAQKGFSLLDYREWKVTPCTTMGRKTNAQRLAEYGEKYPDLADKIYKAASMISSIT
jgi:hypothetical protein